MTRLELTAKYLNELATESPAMIEARDAAAEFGITPVTPAIGAHLASVAASSKAKTILEVGTGTGVSGLWLLKGAPLAQLTSIDVEFDSQQHAKAAFHKAGIAGTKTRLITGRAGDVLPRMNPASYDIVFIDAEESAILEYVEHGLSLVREGGSVLVTRPLLDGRVADPAQRDDTVNDVRALLRELANATTVLAAINPAGAGLLQITTLPS
ncbi:O-methyltransferase [Humidisolicoccus flavus]|uniref:O-methyltransferase n=1 Tax=Humidisolicoccus flavus TaxID=3111414 RepID=UPI0032486AD1